MDENNPLVRKNRLTAFPPKTVKSISFPIYLTIKAEIELKCDYYSHNYNDNLQ